MTTNTTTQWGVRFTWPDGHVETEARDSRDGADRDARVRNRSRTTDGGAVAAVVRRDVTVTDWQVAS